MQVAVFGLGGRVQDVLTECVQLKEETGKSIQVVAICDNCAEESYQFFIKNRLPQQLLADYAHMFDKKVVYPDTDEGIEELFRDHPNLDRIFITSPNHRHYVHLNAALTRSACKTIYLEKPLFRTLKEFDYFNHDLSERTIHVGLTLRYALITKLVAENLRKYKPELGKLQKVHSWEHVNFGHGLSIIMMNWRRYQSLSGGLLLDKSVHDLDLALYFMEAVGVRPEAFSISTEARHDFYKNSNKQNIVDRLLIDKGLQKNVERWESVPWERRVNFGYDPQGAIDWTQSMDNFFSDFPEKDDFSSSDIIPDSHTVTSKIQTESGDCVDFKLDLKLNGFATETQRGCRLLFENGEVEVDMESSKMVIQIKAKEPLEINLNTRGVRHAGGDVYVAHTVLGTLPEGNLSAEFSNPSVQISTIMGLVSEHQALHHLKDELLVRKNNGHWVVESYVEDNK